jgi:hypothetical protein
MHIVNPSLVKKQAAAFQAGAQNWTPSRHEEVPNTLFVSIVKARAMEIGSTITDLLFLYRHKLQNVYVLAYWFPHEVPGMKVMVELMVLPGHPDHMDPKDMPSKKDILDCLRPREKVLKEIRKALMDEDARDREENQFQRDARSEYAVKLRAEGLKDQAAQVKGGLVPLHFERDEKL